MQTALISALTAAFVTLLIEYLAKPRLEVRKDRIVEAARTRRELNSRILTSGFDVVLLTSRVRGHTIDVSTIDSVIKIVEHDAELAAKLCNFMRARQWRAVVRLFKLAEADLAALKIYADSQHAGEDVPEKIKLLADDVKGYYEKVRYMLLIPQWKFISVRRAIKLAENEKPILMQFIKPKESQSNDSR